ncbi:MAG: helix-turn-helix domain-containing protein [Eubacterium sp.]|nr:helix-turn-helix domain-containing protein [Eubacterium sp.]
MEKLSKEEEDKEDQSIESCALRDRDDVLEAINWIEDDIRKKRWNLALFSDEYLETLMNTMEKFKKWVIEHELPTLFGKWGYEIQVGEDGIALCQCRLGYSYNFNAKRFDFIVRPLKMITLKEVGSDLLTPEQYGEKYGFSAGTIRQWIRRGKVHSAVKKGHSWLIPELSHLVANSEIKYIWGIHHLIRMVYMDF